MAWANVAGTLAADSNAATSPWNAGNLSAAVSSGDRLVAAICYNGASGTASVTNVTDSLGNTWVKEVDSGSVLVNGFRLQHTLWSTSSAAGTPSSITITFSGVTGGFGIGLSVTAYSGTDTHVDGTELDISKISTGTATTYDSGTTATTTGAANELKVGTAGDGGSSSTLSAGTLDGAYTRRVHDSPNGNAQTIVEDRDSGASGSTARAEVTTTSTGGWGMAVAVFKLAAGGGGGGGAAPPNRRLLMGVG